MNGFIIVDYQMIFDVLLTLLLVLWAIGEKKWQWPVGSGYLTIPPAATLLAIVYSAHDNNLYNLLIITTIAGILQPLYADRYLTKKTLVYTNKYKKIGESPWFMFLLWPIALFQIMYLCHRLLATNPHRMTYTLTLTLGFTYFMAFELIVNNLTTWWHRENCDNIFCNYATYAINAEFFTVALLPVAYVVVKSESFNPWSIVSGIVYGLIIAVIFKVFCKSAFNEYMARQTTDHTQYHWSSHSTHTTLQS
jgi:hypothetical protein